MGLENKTAIVIGADRGLGRGIVLGPAAEGAKVIVTDTPMETATATADKTNASGGTAKAFAVNIAKQDEVKAMMDSIVESFGTLDVIVNNAGINRDTMLHKTTTEQWDQVIAVNLTGTFYCVQYAVQVMREKGNSATINISPTSWLGNIEQASYAASKADVVGLTKTVCYELARKGITYSAICPGSIDTDMTRGVPEEVWSTMINKIPMGRASSPTDIANTVVFLAFDETDYITGEVISMGDGTIL